MIKCVAYKMIKKPRIIYQENHLSKGKVCNINGTEAAQRQDDGSVGLSLNF
jgi:hypothetical protein